MDDYFNPIESTPRVWPDLLNLPKCPQAAAMGEAAVKETFDNLEKNGFINKSLRLPQRTKREYFWLLLMHLGSHFNHAFSLF